MPWAFICSVFQSFTVGPVTPLETGFKYIQHLCMLEDGNFIVGGDDETGYKLTKYDTETGTEVISRSLTDEPEGMTCICLEGKLSLALSYRYNQFMY